MILLEILTKAINDYRVEGMELMVKLGEKFGYDISVRDQFDELIWKRNLKVPRKGELSKIVNYVFHGGECLTPLLGKPMPLLVFFTNKRDEFG